MDKFIKTHNLPRLNQEETENLDIPIRTIEIEAVIKKLPTNRSPGLDGFPGEFYQTFEEELTSILLKVFQKVQKGKRPPCSSLETSITLILK